MGSTPEDIDGHFGVIKYAPTFEFNIQEVFEQSHRDYKYNVCDIEAILGRVNDLKEKMKAAKALEEQPDMLDARMFTPAKIRPVKRTADNSGTVTKRTLNPRNKKVKENVVVPEPPQRPTRLLRSQASRSQTSSVASNSTANSTANTVIEVSGPSRARAKPKINTTPLRKAPVVHTPVRNNKVPNGDVKLTPLQKKEQKLEEKRLETMRKIEEKDKRIENIQAEKRKIDLLKKAQSELNKTPMNPRGLRAGTPIGQKQAPAMRRNLNVTPMPNFSNQSSSGVSGSSQGNRKFPTRQDSSVSSNSTAGIRKPPAKPVRAAAAAKKAVPAPKARPVPLKKATSKAKIEPVKPARVEVPTLVRHVPPKAETPPPKPAVITPEVTPVMIELSPIRVDSIPMNNQVDISILNPIQFNQINDTYDAPTGKKGQCIASTFLEDTIDPNMMFAHKLPAMDATFNRPAVVNETFDIEAAKENNYEITHYMSESQMDENQAYRNGKLVPKWARGNSLKPAIDRQVKNDINAADFFPPSKPFIDLEAFPELDPALRERIENRDESLAWNLQNL